MKNIVIFDVDGVILNFINSFCNFVNQKLNLSINYDDIINHDLSKIFKVTQDEIWDLIKQFGYTDLSSTLEYYDDSINFINNLSKEFDILILTSFIKPKDSYWRRIKNLSQINYKGIIWDENKELWIENLQPKYIFDDYSNQIRRYLSYRKYFHNIFVPIRPWNKYDIVYNDKVIYFDDYKELKYDNRTITKTT